MDVDTYDFGGKEAAKKVLKIIADGIEDTGMRHLASSLRSETVTETLGRVITCTVLDSIKEAMKPGGPIDAYFKEQSGRPRSIAIQQSASADRAAGSDQSASGTADRNSAKSGND